MRASRHTARAVAMGSTFALALFSGSAKARAQGSWLPYGVSGASDVGVSANGAVWTIGKEAGSIRTLLRVGETTFASPPGTPTRVGADPSGLPWVVNSLGELHHWVRSSTGVEAWAKAPVKAMDVAVGANGSVWAIGTDQRIMRLRGDAWDAIDGAGTRIAVDPAGNPWVVNAGGQIWKHSATGWSLLDGKATDIAIAPDGSVFILGTTPVAGGFEVLRRNGTTWEHIVGGGGVAISAGLHALYVARDAVTNTVVMNTYPTLAVNYHPTTTTSTSATAATATNSGSIVIAPQPVPTLAPPATTSTTKTTTTTTSVVSPITVQLTGGSIDVTPLPPTTSTTTTSIVSGTISQTTYNPSVASDSKLVITGLRPSSSVTTIPGEALCPLFTTLPPTPGRLTKGCSLFGRPARPLGPAPKKQCDAPAFTDPRNGGECWSCPTSYVRNASAVTQPDACWKPVSELLSAATQTGRTGCGSGSFGDPRNGGECWACPAGYGRTLEAVTADRACSKTIIGPFSVASFKGKIGTCNGSSFFDPIDGGTCWTCPAQYRRTALSVTSSKACAQTVPTQYSVATVLNACSASYDSPRGYGTAFREDRNGGECWACPIPLERAKGSDVTTKSRSGIDAACMAGGDTDRIVWQLGQYPEPGLYRFMPGLLSMAMASPKAVDAFLLKSAGGDQAEKRALWAAMISDPAGSAELKALIFASLLTVAKQEKPDLPAKYTLNDFESYMRDRRVYIAEEAVRMHEKWLDVDAYNTTQSVGNSNAFSGMDIGVMGKAGADYKGYAWSAAVPDSAAIEFVLASVALSNPDLTGAFGTSMDTGPRSFKVSDVTSVVVAFEKALDKGIDKAAKVVERAAIAGKAGRGVNGLKGAQGVLLGLTLVAAALDLYEVINTMIEKDKIEKEYAGLVEEASKPVTVREMLESTKPDQHSLLMYWGLVTSPYKASNLLNSGAINTADLCAPTLWEDDCKAAKLVIAAAAKAAGN